MSNVSTKSLILSQRGSSVTGFDSLPALVSEVSHDSSFTTIKVEVPGVDPSTVDVECDQYILRVLCSKGEYTYTVDPTVDTSKVKADIKWGLLTLTIPAPPSPVSHSIKVNIQDVVKSAPSKTTTKFTSEDQG